jgi:hypothetical protein
VWEGLGRVGQKRGGNYYTKVKNFRPIMSVNVININKLLFWPAYWILLFTNLTKQNFVNQSQVMSAKKNKKGSGEVRTRDLLRVKQT